MPRLTRLLSATLAAALPAVVSACLVVGSAPGARAASATATTAHAAASATTGLAAVARPNPVTPGDFTGHGFDQCVAPTQATMDRWLDSSPFLAVGIYTSGASRGCRTQPNLTPTWVRTQLRKGWRLLPITLGPQASCHPGFPRYGNDPTIDPTPGSNNRYAAARKQARAQAATSVRDALALGLTPGSTLWYDLEGYDSTNTRCRESALAFLSAWTWTLHDLGWVSGVYSSAGSGIRDLDDARVRRPNAFVLPDAVWIARWDGVANTSTSYLREDGWRPGGRVKQYRGGHTETWGGVSIPIDSNYLDLGRGSVADRERHCDGVRIGYRGYVAVGPRSGSSRPRMVSAAQCLLTERGVYAGPVTGTFDEATGEAVRTWRARRSMPAGRSIGAAQWTSLLAAGPRPVVKVGSAGPAVRRLQRAINASGAAVVPPRGVFDTATGSALRSWQRAVGVQQSGVLTSSVWRLLQQGRR